MLLLSTIKRENLCVHKLGQAAARPALVSPEYTPTALVYTEYTSLLSLVYTPVYCMYSWYTQQQAPILTVYYTQTWSDCVAKL